MDKQEQVEQLTNYVAHFVAHTAKVLPDAEPEAGEGAEPS